MAGSWPQLERALRRLLEQRAENPNSLLEPVLSFISALVEFPDGNSLLNAYGAYIEVSTGDGTPYASAREAGLLACKNFTPRPPLMDGEEVIAEDVLVELRQSPQIKKAEHELEIELDRIQDVQDAYTPVFSNTPERLALNEWWRVGSVILAKARNIDADWCRSILAIHTRGIECYEAVSLRGKLSQSLRNGICAAAMLLVEELRGMEGQQAPEKPKITIQPVDPVSTGRPCLQRDILWLEWYRQEGETTHRSYAAIRDRWNSMADSARSQVAPQCKERLPAGRAGTDRVKAALRKAAEENT